MNVIVHYPQKQESIQALQEKVAVLHSKAITRFLEKLTCPKEQKLQLIKKIQESIRGKE